jgi:hypothetical protein
MENPRRSLGFIITGQFWMPANRGKGRAGNKEGRGKREEGRGKREEGHFDLRSSIFNL